MVGRTTPVFKPGYYPMVDVIPLCSTVLSASGSSSANGDKKHGDPNKKDQTKIVTMFVPVAFLKPNATGIADHKFHTLNEAQMLASLGFFIELFNSASLGSTDERVFTDSFGRTRPKVRVMLEACVKDPMGYRSEEEKLKDDEILIRYGLQSMMRKRRAQRESRVQQQQQQQDNDDFDDQDIAYDQEFHDRILRYLTSNMEGDSVTPSARKSIHELLQHFETVSDEWIVEHMTTEEIQFYRFLIAYRMQMQDAGSSYIHVEDVHEFEMQRQDEIARKRSSQIELEWDDLVEPGFYYDPIDDCVKKVVGLCSLVHPNNFAGYRIIYIIEDSTIDPNECVKSLLDLNRKWLADNYRSKLTKRIKNEKYFELIRHGLDVFARNKRGFGDDDGGDDDDDDENNNQSSSFHARRRAANADYEDDDDDDYGGGGGGKKKRRGKKRGGGGRKKNKTNRRRRRGKGGSSRKGSSHSYEGRYGDEDDSDRDSDYVVSSIVTSGRAPDDFDSDSSDEDDDSNNNNKSSRALTTTGNNNTTTNALAKSGTSRTLEDDIPDVGFAAANHIKRLSTVSDPCNYWRLICDYKSFGVSFVDLLTQSDVCKRCEALDSEDYGIAVLGPKENPLHYINWCVIGQNLEKNDVYDTGICQAQRELHSYMVGEDYGANTWRAPFPRLMWEYSMSSWSVSMLWKQKFPWKISRFQMIARDMQRINSEHHFRQLMETAVRRKTLEYPSTYVEARRATSSASASAEQQQQQQVFTVDQRGMRYIEQMNQLKSGILAEQYGDDYVKYQEHQKRLNVNLVESQRREVRAQQMALEASGDNTLSTTQLIKMPNFTMQETSIVLSGATSNSGSMMRKQLVQQQQQQQQLTDYITCNSVHDGDENSKVGLRLCEDGGEQERRELGFGSVKESIKDSGTESYIQGDLESLALHNEPIHQKLCLLRDKSCDDAMKLYPDLLEAYLQERLEDFQVVLSHDSLISDPMKKILLWLESLPPEERYMSEEFNSIDPSLGRACNAYARDVIHGRVFQLQTSCMQTFRSIFAMALSVYSMGYRDQLVRRSKFKAGFLAYGPPGKGKSYVLECLMEAFIKGTLMVDTASSDLHNCSGAYQSDRVTITHEAPHWMQANPKRMARDEHKVHNIQKEAMTSQHIEYSTQVYDPATGTRRPLRMIMDYSNVTIGATNTMHNGDETSLQSRFIISTVANDPLATTFRVSEVIGCQFDEQSRRNSIQFIRSMHKRQLFTAIAWKMVSTFTIPAYPNIEVLVRHWQAVLGLLGQYYPSILVEARDTEKLYNPGYTEAILEAYDILFCSEISPYMDAMLMRADGGAADERETAMVEARDPELN